MPCDCKCPTPACVEKLISRTGSKYSRFSSPFAKIFRFSRSRNHLYVLARPAFLSEGRLAIVTDVGGGMRWTRWYRWTSGIDAYGEDAWS
jgi:hypothetical protein